MPHDQRPRKLTFSVPELPDKPYVGSLCCVVAAGELIAEEFSSWPHVGDVRVDVPAGRVEVELRGVPPTAQDLLDTLADFGYPASVVAESGAPRMSPAPTSMDRA